MRSQRSRDHPVAPSCRSASDALRNTSCGMTGPERALPGCRGSFQSSKDRMPSSKRIPRDTSSQLLRSIGPPLDHTHASGFIVFQEQFGTILKHRWCHRARPKRQFYCRPAALVGVPTRFAPHRQVRWRGQRLNRSGIRRQSTQRHPCAPTSRPQRTALPARLPLAK